MKQYSPIFLSLIFASFLFLSSCNDKKAVEEKAKAPVEVKKEAPKVVEPTPVKKVVEATPKPVVKKIFVKEGEWLCDISRREYGNMRNWQKIYDANKAIIDNPDLIYPNQELVIPD